MRTNCLRKICELLRCFDLARSRQPKGCLRPVKTFAPRISLNFPSTIYSSSLEHLRSCRCFCRSTIRNGLISDHQLFDIYYNKFSKNNELSKPALGSLISQSWPVKVLKHFIFFPLKGGDPAADSSTATLLRLHPSYQPYLRRLPPKRLAQRRRV